MKPSTASKTTRKGVSLPVLTTNVTANAPESTIPLKSPYSRKSSIKNYKVTYLLNEIFTAAERDTEEMRRSASLKESQLTFQMFQTYYSIRTKSSLHAELKRRALVELIECEFHIRRGDWKCALDVMSEYESQIKGGVLKNGEGFALKRDDQQWALRCLLQCHKFCLVVQCDHFRRDSELELLYVKLSQLKRVVAHERDFLEQNGGSAKQCKKDLISIENEMRELKEMIRWELRQYSQRAQQTEQKNEPAHHYSNGTSGSDASVVHSSSEERTVATRVKSPTIQDDSLPPPLRSSSPPLADSMVFVSSTTPNSGRKRKQPPPPTFAQRRTPSMRRYSQTSHHDSPYLSRSLDSTIPRSPSNTAASISPYKRRNSTTPSTSTRKNSRPSFFKSVQILDQIVPKTQSRLPSAPSGSQSARQVSSSSSSFSRATSAKRTRRNSFQEQILLSAPSSSSSTTIVQRREKTQIDYIMDRLEYIRSVLVEDGSYQDALQASRNILLTLHIGEIAKQPAVFVDLYALTSTLHERLGDMRLSINMRRKAIEIAQKYHLQDLLDEEKEELARLQAGGWN